MDLVEISVLCSASSPESGLAEAGRTADDVAVDVAVEHLDVAEVHHTTLRNHGAEPLCLDRVVVSYDHHASEVLEHGWQSWSTVRRTRPDDPRPERRDAPRWFRAEMHADEALAGVVVSADTLLVTDRGVLGALGATRNLVTFVVQPDGQVEAHQLLDGLVVEPGGAVDLEDLFCGEGDPGVLYDRYAELAGAHNDARVDQPGVVGWCSWYHYFADIDAQVIGANLALAADRGCALVQIDDGWQPEIGTWDRTKPGFGGTLDELGQAIAAEGLDAGLWTAPFCAIEGGQLATEHPEWLIRDSDGRPRKALFHQGWGGWVFALDTTNAEVLEHLRSLYHRLRLAGFRYHKIDFCFAAAIPGQRARSGEQTRAQAIRLGLEAIRDGIGEEAFLLGCGAPLLSAVGIVDAMRVSEDVAPYWAPRLFFPGYPESTVAVRNAVEQSALRAPLHRRWFLNDPDCLLLRPTETELTEAERLDLARCVLGTGAYLMFSDDLATYGEREWRLVEQLRTHRRDADSPLHLVDPFATPLVVDGLAMSLQVDWETPAATLREHRGHEVLAAEDGVHPA